MKESGDPLIARDRAIGGDVNIRHALEIDHAAGICHPERSRVERSEIRESRRIPTKPVQLNAASGGSHESMEPLLRMFRNVQKTVRAALREIFDESAYDRFLLRTNASRSVASYRDFSRERDAAVLKKPRCC